ncbi:MAG: hypothetical protein ACJ78Q_00120 [Chloroflexia bacterium]
MISHTPLSEIARAVEERLSGVRLEVMLKQGAREALDRARGRV